MATIKYPVRSVTLSNITAGQIFHPLCPVLLTTVVEAESAWPYQPRTWGTPDEPDVAEQARLHPRCTWGGAATAADDAIVVVVLGRRNSSAWIAEDDFFIYLSQPAGVSGHVEAARFGLAFSWEFRGVSERLISRLAEWSPRVAGRQIPSVPRHLRPRDRRVFNQIRARMPGAHTHWDPMLHLALRPVDSPCDWETDTPCPGGTYITPYWRMREGRLGHECLWHTLCMDSPPDDDLDTDDEEDFNA
jgi:hypothetical protein